MSQSESLKVLQEAYANFKRGDIPALLEMMTTDVEWYLPCSPEVVPFAGRRSGREQVSHFFSKLNELQETEQFEPARIHRPGRQSRWVGTLSMAYPFHRSNL